MHEPAWEQNISFKSALAVAAVLTKNYEAKLAAAEDRCSALSEELEQLKAKELHAPENLSSLVAPGINDGSAFPAFSLQDQLRCMEKWMQASEAVAPELHLFLARLQQYAAHRRRGDGRKQLYCTPAQACIEALQGVLMAAPGAADAQQHSQIISNATACLAALCMRPLELLDPSDWEALQDFTGGVVGHIAGTPMAIATTSTPNQEPAHPIVNLPPGGAGNQVDKILSALVASSSTAYIVLGCAAHALLAAMSCLVAAVTGEHQELTPGGNAELPANEAGSAAACLTCASLLQRCLKTLPAAMADHPPDDDFLRSVAKVVWAVSEKCSVVAPVHPQVAKEGQRCAALLVSAFQRACHQGDGSRP